ncbi:MAG TPA: bb3-type cytochrome oxidase subunit III [Albitalea sp.]|nr:bb3-type cytochrome oxidase subunit III [Albitalea sp.]
MNSSTTLFRVTGSGRDDSPGIPHVGVHRRHRPGAAGSVGLWVFIGVATSLFALFITAYVMRLAGSDATAIVMPWQLWLSTSALVAGSVTLQQSAAAAQAAQAERARTLLLAGGACALAFLAVQGWAWQALLVERVMPVGNPAGSFFYVLTTLHGLHVAGGLVAWGWTAHQTWRQADARPTAWRVALCARYWHFLLLVWVALFASFVWVTPDVARIICGVTP